MSGVTTPQLYRNPPKAYNTCSMKPLTTEQHHWVEQTLAALSTEERIAQLLIPRVDPGTQIDELIGILKEIPCGGLFVWGNTAEEHRSRLARIQAVSRVPIVVSADLENGAGHAVFGMTAFPDNLALAANDSEELAYTMGQAAAVEGRSVGIHWTFAPVVDVNVNPDNPIANTRSLGDDVERISRLARAIIRGLQEHGVAACAKHFPGDGIDDFDQHAVTSVNSLPLEKWKAISGRTFSAAFDGEAWSTMIGHIALPAWDPEIIDARKTLRPATVSKPIVTDLLRRQMGFQGLVVTDDMNMGGVSGYMNRKDRVVGCINAGCDMLLFPELPRDYRTLVDAYRDGSLSKERIDEAARRVLEFKARLNLHRGETAGRKATSEETRKFRAASKKVAEDAICCVRDVSNLLPLKRLRDGAKVITITLTNDFDLKEVDQALQARGYAVEHLCNPDDCNISGRWMKMDAVFVNFSFRANWAVSSVRSAGPFNRIFMGGFYMEHPCVVFTSFGSPYHLRQFSALPNLINVHSATPDSQQAAVAAWFGEIPMIGKSPVQNLVRTF